ncbi:MAG: MotA/TolQ/ExbB proton channel family protein [Planctomycetota bacterium]|nr:MotA/TolQ/ExbB proton channel family protein [Planctomycetota bacterium]
MPTGHLGFFRHFGRLGVTAALAAVLVSTTLWAQSAPPAPAPAPVSATPAPRTVAPAPGPAGINPDTGQLPTFEEFFKTNPIINSIIAGLSVIAVAFFLVFLFTLHTGRMMPSDFGDDVTRLVASRRYADAAEYCRRHRRIFAASIIQRCVENSDKSHATLLNIIDAEGKRRAELVWNRVSYLLDLSNIAPMLGLLGTVLGMIQAFEVSPSQSTGLHSKLLAQSIGGAMSATFFGLGVAILCVVFYSVIKTRTTKALSEVERVVHQIADHMKRGEA